MPTLDELISIAAKKVEDTGGADDIFEQIAELYPDEDLDELDAQLAEARRVYRLFALKA
jgi:hypothetical protein